MAPDSLAGLLILVVAVLPGSIFTWAYERQVGSYGVDLADRVLRFVAVSVIFHLAMGWLEFFVYRSTLAGHSALDSGEFGVVWLGALIIVAVPAGVGTLLGGLYATRTARTGWRWIRNHISPEQEARLLLALLGRTPAPRAWDDLFSERPNAYLRIRLDNDRWLAGRFSEGSYAGGFPHDTDLYLEQAWEVDQETGVLGAQGLGFPVYVPADTIKWIEVLQEQAL